MDREYDNSSSDSFTENYYNDEDEQSFSEASSDSSFERPLLEEEIEELIDELLHLESKAAEAQEALEEESLKQTEAEVRAELSASFTGNELENVIRNEMETFKDQWEFTLDRLEDKISILQDQLDNAGIELSALYKWIEQQTPEGCSTETWKKRTHWSGSQVTREVMDYVNDAECDLNEHRPVRRNHGKLLEEGASGYLSKKFSIKDDTRVPVQSVSDKDWKLLDAPLQSMTDIQKDKVFGSNQWAAMYLACTPQQAADLGLDIPGVNEVEEIDDFENYSRNPKYEAAVENEKEHGLTEEQKCKMRKVKEEDDIERARKLQRRLMRREKHKRRKMEGRNVKDKDMYQQSKSSVLATEVIDVEKDHGTDENSQAYSSHSLGEYHGETISRKRNRGSDHLEFTSKLNEIVIVGSDDENDTTENNAYQSEGICTERHPTKPYCTACGRGLKASRIHRHPLLGVAVCKTCRNHYDHAQFEKASDGSESLCRWCCRGGNLVCCDTCEKVFCEQCITQNFGRTVLNRIRKSDWYCFCCAPGPLCFLVEAYKYAAKEMEKHLSPDNKLSSYKRKRIKGIIDDADLAEETREKMAIEKERQNHLEMLQKLSTVTQESEILTRECGALTHFDQSSIYGNASEGFIINIARESNEKIVRIPPSISVCLKSHQVSGIQFMWENCIQSINRVKSGDKGLGCILAHSMGLGKTLQVITFLYIVLCSADLGLSTALIVTPVNVLHNWKQEFEKWRPLELKCLPVFIIDDATRDNARRAKLLKKWLKKGGVLLIGYASFRMLSLGKHIKEKNLADDICNTLQSGPDILICDEAHIIKNTKADVTQVLKQVKTQRKIALTGSPLQNNLMEYYCMVDFVREGFLGTPHEFRNRFQKPIENGQHANSTTEDVKLMNQRSHVLHEQLKGFVQRVSTSAMSHELPSKSVFVISVKLSSLQRKLYSKFLQVGGFTDTNEKVSTKRKRRCFFYAYHTLSKIWNHPAVLLISQEDTDTQCIDDMIENILGYTISSEDDTEIECGDETHNNKNRLRGSQNRVGDDIIDESFKKWWEGILPNSYSTRIEDGGKMVLLLDILKMSSKQGDKVLVFSQSLNTLDLIESFLITLSHPTKKKFWRRGKEWYRLDGSTSAAQRQKLVEDFNDPSNKTVQCVLISTRAGALGINLPAANRVVIVDGSWNPTHDLQAVFRAWRIGQRKHVYAYRLVAHGTMEEKIYKRQVAKEGLAARVVDRQQVCRTMTKEEILHLFRLEDGATSDRFSELLSDVNYVTSACENEILPYNDLDSPEGDASFMRNLLTRHNQRWLVNYHEHDALLQENENERLSKEDQETAWENYKRFLASESMKQLAESPSFSKCNPSDSQGSQILPICTLPSLDKNSVSRTSKGGESTKSSDLKNCTVYSHAVAMQVHSVTAGNTYDCPKCKRKISWETLQ